MLPRLVPKEYQYDVSRKGGYLPVREFRRVELILVMVRFYSTDDPLLSSPDPVRVEAR